MLELIFKHMKWENRGTNVEGERLNDLRYADYIVIILDTLEDTDFMPNSLNKASQNTGEDKCLFMTNLVPTKCLSVNSRRVELRTLYRYLGHDIGIGQDNQTVELTRRINLTWIAFGNLRGEVFKTNLAIYLTTKFTTSVC